MRFRTWPFVALALALGSCAHGFQATPPVVGSAGGAAAPAVRKPAVYVAYAGGVNVYNAKAGLLLTRIVNGISSATALTFDRFGTLYVANGGNDTVTAYPAGKRTPSITYAQGISGPVALAVKKTLYVLDLPKGGGFVTQYARGTGKLQLKITKGMKSPFAIALDPSRNLYVGNSTTSSGSVQIYPPNSGSPSRSLVFGSSSGAQALTAMTMDSRGVLYVGDTFPASLGTAGSAVAAFPPGGSKPSRILRPGQTFDSSANAAVVGLTVDSANNLYVAVAACAVSSFSSACGAPYSGAVVEYRPNGTSPIRTIRSLILPGPMAIDAAGNLYVGDCSDAACANKGGVMYVFLPGQSTPQRTVQFPSGGPYAIATPP
jgi:hypothetical protein